MSAGITMAGLASGLAIAGGINSLTGGGITSALGLGGSQVGGGTGTGAQTAADPFAPYRGQLAGQYANELAPGASANIQSMPGFTQYNTGVMQPAMQASQRTAASTGQLYSGGEQQALQKTGQQGYYGFMTDYMNRLAQGSGATQNPATAAGMGLNQGNLNQQGVSQGFGALGTAVSGLASQFGGGAGSTSSTVANSMGQMGMGQVDASSGEYMGSLGF